MHANVTRFFSYPLSLFGKIQKPYIFKEWFNDWYGKFFPHTLAKEKT